MKFADELREDVSLYPSKKATQERQETVRIFRLFTEVTLKEFSETCKQRAYRGERFINFVKSFAIDPDKGTKFEYDLKSYSKEVNKYLNAHISQMGFLRYKIKIRCGFFVEVDSIEINAFW